MKQEQSARTEAIDPPHPVVEDPGLRRLLAELAVALFVDDVDAPHVVVRVDPVDGPLSAHGPYLGYLAAEAAAAADRAEWEQGSPGPMVRPVRCFPPRR